jgi:hypothetical protein
MNDDFREEIPQIFVTLSEKSRERIRLTFDIGHWRPMPFGLTYWDDLSDFEVESCTGGADVKVIKDKLAFLRFNLTGDKRKIELNFRRKS